MTFDARRTTLSHLEAVTKNDHEYFTPQSLVQDTAILDAISRFASFLYSLGRYEAAEKLYRRAFEGRIGLLGEEHRDTLASMNSLALLLKSQGKYEEAEPKLRQTLALREKVLGKEHPDTLASMNNLAGVLKSQGKYEEAESMLRQRSL
jgi:tetratricopeptide (TPR) repeat protein